MVEFEAGAVLGAAAGGVAIGLLYFAALWWTVRRIPSTGHPAVLLAGSFLIRAAVAAVGLVFVSGGQPFPLLAAAAGFLLGRTIVIRAVRRPLRSERLPANAVAGSGEATTLTGPDSR